MHTAIWSRNQGSQNYAQGQLRGKFVFRFAYIIVYIRMSRFLHSYCVYVRNVRILLICMSTAIWSRKQG